MLKESSSSSGSSSSSSSSESGDRYDTKVRYTVNLLSGVQSNGKRLLLVSFQKVAKVELDLPFYVHYSELRRDVKKIIKNLASDEINKSKSSYNKTHKSPHVHINHIVINSVSFGNYIDNSEDCDSWEPEEPWSISNREASADKQLSDALC